jgi:multiple sugar transport system ATP-binding protein
MGSPAMNLLEGQVAGSGTERRIALRRSNGAEPLQLAVPASVRESQLSDGQDVILGIRPEAITDRGLTDPEARAVSFVEAPVDLVEPTGSDTFVVTQIAGKEITARVRSDVDARPGEPFEFAFNLDKAVVFDPKTTKRLG